MVWIRFYSHYPSDLSINSATFASTKRVLMGLCIWYEHALGTHLSFQTEIWVIPNSPYEAFLK